jgi:hypothetical protein
LHSKDAGTAQQLSQKALCMLMGTPLAKAHKRLVTFTSNYVHYAAKQQMGGRRPLKMPADGQAQALSTTLLSECQQVLEGVRNTGYSVRNKRLWNGRSQIYKAPQCAPFGRQGAAEVVEV